MTESLIMVIRGAIYRFFLKHLKFPHLLTIAWAYMYNNVPQNQYPVVHYWGHRIWKFHDNILLISGGL